MSRTTSALGRAIAALALTAALAVGSALTALPAAHAQSDGDGDARFALVIGANQGGQGDVELLYAEQDASRVGEALTALGDVPPEGLVVLRAPDAEQVSSVLATLGGRVAAARAAGRQTVLFVYYSGHADAGGLRLGDTDLPYRRLETAVEATGADVSVLVFDACQSGGLTRRKGAVPAQPFEIRADDRMAASGLAIITSSAAGEDAQESDRLGGGIFTHHLLGGIYGAADVSQDGRVTLSEVFKYAYAQTIETTSKTRFVQHPSYAFELAGQKELVVARLGRARAFGRLTLELAGSYVLLSDARRGESVLEVDVEAGTTVVVPPATYTVRRRGRSEVLEAKVTVGRRARVTVAEAAMHALPYGRTLRRGLAGEGGRSSAWSLGLAMEASAPVFSGFTPGLYAVPSVRVDLAAVALELRLRWGLATASNATVDTTQQSAGADLGLYRLFDLGDSAFSAGVGVRMGIDWIHQAFETLGTAPPRYSVAGRVAPVVRLEAAPGSRVTLVLDAGVEVFLIDGLGSDGKAELTTPVVPFGALGFRVLLP